MPKLEVRYITGDATRPQAEGLKIVAHCCNNLGAWGSGFVLAISKLWTRPEAEYRRWFEEKGAEEFREMLGATQLVPVEPDIWIANIIGQAGLRISKEGVPPVRYDAISHGFKTISEYAQQNRERNLSVHAPRLGCGLAAGSWDQIEPLLEEHFIEHGIPVTIYDLP